MAMHGWIEPDDDETRASENRFGTCTRLLAKQHFFGHKYVYDSSKYIMFLELIVYFCTCDFKIYLLEPNRSFKGNNILLLVN